MHQPYTGCNPRGMLLSRDKVLSKQLLTYHRIPTPQFMLFPRGKKPRISKKLRFPMFVKSSTEDASLGIAHASVVADEKQLAERVAFIHEQTHSDALVEEYIEGRELYVGVIGNDRLKVLPVWEMTFGTLPEGLPAIATRKVKWDRVYQEKYGITTAAAADLPEGTMARLEQLSKRIFRALHLTGYARMDFRLRADGALYALEANANPNISMAEDFSQSALMAGLGYRDVLNRILQLGANYPAAWRGIES
jgi:D-alanine-D-alanine ligase